MHENLDTESIGVKCKIIENQSLKAIVGLDFGEFTVKGFRISKSKYTPDSSNTSTYEDELWVVPPSYQDNGGKYHPIFFIPDKELWESLKERILAEYDKQAREHYDKRFDNPGL